MTTRKYGRVALRSLIPRGSIAKAFFAVAGGTAASQLISLALTPLVTRLFAPDAFGVLAAYMAILLVAQPVIALRYELAIPLAESDEEATRLLAISFSIVAMFSVLATLLAIVGVATGSIAALGLEELGDLVWLLPLGMLLTGVYQTLRFWAIRKKDYRAIAYTTVSQSIGRGMIQVGTGLMKIGPWGLVLGEIVGQSAGVAKLSRPAIGALRNSRIVWSQVVATARKRIAFPLKMAPAALLQGTGRQLPALLLVAFYGPEVAGWYFVTERIISVPVQLVGGAMGQVFLGEAADLARNNPVELRALFNRLSRRLLFVSLVPAVIVVSFGPWAAEILLGPGWRQAGVYMQWLTISFVCKLSFDGLINLAILNRESFALAWAAVRLVLVASAVYMCHILGTSDVVCVASIAIAMAASYLLKLLFWTQAMSARIQQWEVASA